MIRLSMELIEEARKYLDGRIRNTPVEHSRVLSELLGGLVFLKLENLQITGSFKLRGAYFRLSKLSEEERRKGVITCSAGNHGKAVSYVASQLEVPVTIYVPSNVDQSKYDGMKALGAEVIRSPHIGYDDTEVLAKEAAVHSGRPFISAFDDYCVMAGNGGTLGVEILDQVPEVRTIIVPVGGGGLSAGLSYYVKERSPEVQVIGCQHKDSAALQQSLEKGEAVTALPSIETVAGGLEGGIGKNSFGVLRSRIDGCSLVEEAEIYRGFRWCLENHQYLVEPSAVVVIAAVISGKLDIKQFPAVVVLSGRNVGMGTIETLLQTNLSG